MRFPFRSVAVSFGALLLLAAPAAAAPAMRRCGSGR